MREKESMPLGMNNYKIIVKHTGIVFSLIVVSIGLYSLFTPINLKAQDKPSIYDLEKLNDIKRYPGKYESLSVFLNDTRSLAKEKLLTVVDKELTFAPSKNYYCSISRYFWPNADNPDDAYIIRDGITNPEFSKYDGEKLEQLASKIQYLSTAFYITGDREYREACIMQIKAWFLDEETRMLPNFEYAQVLKGVNDNKGQSYGLAELSRFLKIIESIMLLDYAEKLEEDVMNGTKAWFRDFLTWVLNSRQWAIQSKSNNNITSTCYVTLVEMALFVNNMNVANKLAKEFKKRVLDVQIDKDGKQPAELARTLGFGYSVGNLIVIVDFCLVMENLGGHFYKDNQKVIDSAFAYLYRFVGHREVFPYQQISAWDYYENSLLKNMSRLERMEGKRSKVKRLAHKLKYKESSLLDLVY